MMKDNTVTTNPPINVTAHNGIDSKNPHASIEDIIELGNTEFVEPLMFDNEII